MRTHAWIRWIAAAGAVSLVATGCSLGGDAGEGTAEDPTTMNELLGLPDSKDVDYAAMDEKFEDAVAACMAEQGWEYVPAPSLESEFPEFTDADERAYIEERGYGMVWEVLYPTSDGDSSEAALDHNAQYYASLSDDEKVAYDASLNGTQEEQDAAWVLEVDPETGEEYFSSTDVAPGCIGAAQDEVYENDISRNPGVQAAVQEYYSEVAARVEADPRKIELFEKIAACTPAEDQPSVATIQAQVADVVGEDFFARPWDDWTDQDWTEFYDTHTQDEIDALFEVPAPELTAEQRSALETVLADEIEIAMAEYTCSKDLWAESRQIQAEIEAQCVREHEAEISQLVAAISGGEQ